MITRFSFLLRWLQYYRNEGSVVKIIIAVHESGMRFP